MKPAKRVAELDWAAIGQELADQGYAQTGRLLTPDECQALVALYDERSFRKRVDMAQHRFGAGEYKYFEYPLPPVVAELRTALYPELARVANHWARIRGAGEDFPASHAEFLGRCRSSGQCKPTPLLLRYEAGGYNCLHQDLYGAVAFPLQAVFLLSRPEEDFTGGEFLLVEQRPRAQSRGEAIAIEQGAAVLFTTRERPVAGTRGSYRVQVRHGLSRVRSGRRFALGIIFHDAE
jgi:hypothetical protein